MSKADDIREALSNKQVKIKELSAAEEQAVENSLIRSRIQILLHFPFFGMLAMHLEYEKDYKTPTAGTDGGKFFYNPYFIKALSEPERNWIVIHEVMHPALKHMWRRGTREHQRWNYACDYAIHSIMMEYLNEATSNARNILRMPKNCLYDPKYDGMSAEQIYELLPQNPSKSAKYGNGSGKGQGNGNSRSNDENQSDNQSGSPLDDHSRWDEANAQQNKQQKMRQWDGRMVAAAQAAEAKSAGKMPAFLQRIISKIVKPQKDWRMLLAEFVQPMVDDYSWTPPDNRLDTEDFGGILMPSFSDTVDVVKDIIFYIDTSGSIGMRELTVAYSELVGAIEQFKGKLSGKVGFFDAEAYPLHDFDDVTDIMKIKPVGGGGTDFRKPFEYVDKNVDEENVAGIVILTDGYDEWPPEQVAKGKPVLWLITNEDRVPTWGQHTTVKVDHDYENGN